MQTINVANNCKVLPKSFAHIKPFRKEEPLPKQKEKALRRMCEREALKEIRAKQLRENFLNRREKLMREMGTIIRVAEILNHMRGV